MTRPAHNSTLPLPLIYKNKNYTSLMSLWTDVKDQSKVSLQTFSVRIRNRLENEAINDEIVDECHLMNTAEYKKYGIRKTYVKTSQGILDLKSFFENIADAQVKYDVFRNRVVKIAKERELSMLDIKNCSSLSNEQWRIFAGGGRSERFIYDGCLHPDALGEHPSFAAFLRKINRYQDKGLLTRRKKNQWDIDVLLSEPAKSTGQSGYIYKIEDLETGKLYVGLSINKPHVRFSQHVNLAKGDGKSPLHEAIRKNGRDGFSVSTIEEVDGDETRLAEREKYWIENLNTLVPYGLNVRKGGQLGYCQGKEVIDGKGRKFKSKNEMCRVISKETGMPEHVVRSRFDANKPLPEKARSRSKHPEAGTLLFRQWKGMKKRAKGDVVEAWLDYNKWKADVNKNKKEGQLTRIDDSKPWGPNNFTYLSREELRAKTNGKSFSAFGKTWPSKSKALSEFGIKSNLFDYRIKKGMSYEEALNTPHGKTRKKEIFHKNEQFKSMTEASKILAGRYGMTVGQVKDRLSRNVPFENWPINKGKI